MTPAQSGHCRSTCGATEYVPGTGSGYPIYPALSCEVGAIHYCRSTETLSASFKVKSNQVAGPEPRVPISWFRALVSLPQLSQLIPALPKMLRLSGLICASSYRKSSLLCKGNHEEKQSRQCLEGSQVCALLVPVLSTLLEPVSPTDHRRRPSPAVHHQHTRGTRSRAGGV